MNETFLISGILHSSTSTNMGCTSSKEAQVTTTARTEKTEEGYKHITEKRTKHPGFFGGETVETITATIGGNPTLVGMIENGVQYDFSDGQALHDFAKGSCVRNSLQKFIIREACGVATGSFDMNTRTFTLGSYTFTCMLVGVLTVPSLNSARFTWGWAQPDWNEKVDAPVKRLQLMGEALNNKDLKSDAIIIDSPNDILPRAEQLGLDAANAAAQVLGHAMWVAFPMPDGQNLVAIADAEAAKPPLPADAFRKPNLGDLHTYFGEIWDSQPPATFNAGIVGLASSSGWVYETMSDGWSLSEPCTPPRRLVFKWDGSTNAAGKPQYEHTLYGVSPVTIDGVSYNLDLAYTIKANDVAEGQADTPAAAAAPGSTDCRQLIDFARDTFTYTVVRSDSWLKDASHYVGANDDQDLILAMDRPDLCRIAHVSKSGPNLLVPREVVATVNLNTRVLEWCWSDPATASPAANQIRSAGVDEWNSDLSTAKLTVAPGIDMEDVATAVSMAAAKATGLHVTASSTGSNGVVSIGLLRVHEVQAVPVEEVRLADVFHGFDSLWSMRSLFDLQGGANALAAKLGWTLTPLQAPLPGWILTEPASGSTFTFQDDHIKRETGDDYKIALDTKVAVSVNDGQLLNLNIHVDNSPRN